MNVNLIDVDLNHTWSQPGMKGKQKRKILPQLKNCIYKCTRIFENEKSDNNIYFFKIVPILFRVTVSTKKMYEIW